MSFFAPQPSVNGRHLVLYDGDCGLCDRTVQFLLPRDRGEVLHYAPLQGSTAGEARRRLGVPPDLDSLLFVLDEGTPEERVLVRSSGVLAILGVIGGPWRLLSWLRWVPRPIRDALYDFVARRRIGWFGRPETCRLPGGKLAGRFLD